MTFTATYLKVGKGLRSGEGFSVVAYQEGMQQNCMLLHNDVEFYAVAYQKVWTRVFFFFFKHEF